MVFVYKFLFADKTNQVLQQIKLFAFEASKRFCFFECENASK